MMMKKRLDMNKISKMNNINKIDNIEKQIEQNKCKNTLALLFFFRYFCEKIDQSFAQDFASGLAITSILGHSKDFLLLIKSDRE